MRGVAQLIPGSHTDHQRKQRRGGVVEEVEEHFEDPRFAVVQEHDRVSDDHGEDRKAAHHIEGIEAHASIFDGPEPRVKLGLSTRRVPAIMDK